MAGEKKSFPDGMIPIGNGSFSFDCHPGVECFTVCCKDVDMILYPYDVLMLKNCLGIDSGEFIREHTYLVRGENPFFPTVKLKLEDNEEKSCPFLAEKGCNVYEMRPSACRTYPLERAVDRSVVKGKASEFYFLTDHPYCLGHREKRIHSVQSWIRNQRLLQCNSMNELWVELDTIFMTNPWKGEGAGGEKQQLAFMVCYNIDSFREFTARHKLLGQFRIERNWKKMIATDDTELMKFGFEWLKLILTGKSKVLR